MDGPSTGQSEFEDLLAQIKAGASSQSAPVKEPSNWERFLEALRTGKHPAFCELIWTGEAYHVALRIHFQKTPHHIPPPGPEAEVYRREAYRRFNRLNEAEQQMTTIRVTIRNWLPVDAEVTVRPEAAGVLRFGTNWLLDFQNP